MLRRYPGISAITSAKYREGTNSSTDLGEYIHPDKVKPSNQDSALDITNDHQNHSSQTPELPKSEVEVDIDKLIKALRQQAQVENTNSQILEAISRITVTPFGVRKKPGDPFPFQTINSFINKYKPVNKYMHHQNDFIKLEHKIIDEIVSFLVFTVKEKRRLCAVKAQKMEDKSKSLKTGDPETGQDAVKTPFDNVGKEHDQDKVIDEKRKTEDEWKETVRLRKEELAQFCSFACRLFRIFSRVDSVAKWLGQNQGVKTIEYMMRAYPRCPNVQPNCAAVLANLAIVPVNLAIMRETMCLHILVKNIERFKSSPGVLIDLMGALSNLTCYDSTTKHLLQLPLPNLVVDTIDTYPNHDELLIHAFHVVAGIAKFSTVGVQMDMNRMVRLIEKALDEHLESPDVITSVCAALGSLPRPLPNIIEHRDQLSARIVRAMSAHKLSVNLQTTCMYALAHLHHRDERERSTVAKEQAFDLILDAMRAFPDNEAVQSTSLFALGLVIPFREYNKVLGKGAISLILQAVSRAYSPPEDAQARSHMPKPAVTVRGGRNNTLVNTESIMRFLGVGILMALAQVDEYKKHMLEEGAIYYIFKAKKATNSRDVKFLAEAVLACLTISNSEGSRPLILRPCILQPRTGIPTLRRLAQSAIVNLKAYTPQSGTKASQRKLRTAWSVLVKLFKPSGLNSILSRKKKSIPRDIKPEEKGVVDTHVEKLSIPDHLKSEIMEYQTCHSCGRVTYENTLQFYCRDDQTRCTQLQFLCSLNCAREHAKFSDCQILSTKVLPWTLDE